MGEIKTEAKTYIINYVCDICGKSIVQLVDRECVKGDDGESHMVYTYKCPSCGNTEELTDILYPHVIHEPIQ